MSFVSLEQAKAHLYISDDAHDQYITDLIAAAEEYVQDDIGQKFSDMAEVPQLLVQAVLFIVAHWFENREPVSTNTVTVARPLPLAYESIIWKFRTTSFC